MGARRTNIVPRKEEREDWRHRVCDDCAFGTWNTWTEWNFDHQGRPITLRCPHYKDGKYGIVRGTPACNKFADKKPTGV